MDKSSLTRRKMLSTVGATGLASVGVLGFMTRGSVRYTKTVPVEGSSLEVDWRETYNGEVLENTRTESRFMMKGEGAVIDLEDVLPGDVGTVSFRLRNPEDADSTLEPKLALVLTETAEKERVDPEDEAGDDSTGEGELQDFIDTKLWYDEGLMNFDVFGGDNATYDGEELIADDAEGTLADVADEPDEVEYVSLGELGPSETVTVSFRWEFDSDADPQDVDVTQTDSVGFAFRLNTTSVGEL